MHTHILRDADGNEAGRIHFNSDLSGEAQVTQEIEGVGDVSVWVPAQALADFRGYEPQAEAEAVWLWATLQTPQGRVVAKVETLDGFPRQRDGVYRIRHGLDSSVLAGQSPALLFPAAVTAADLVEIVPAWRAKALDEVLAGLG
jgi:hypothetical protein